MGAALTHAILKADNSVTVWNRTKDRPHVVSVTEAGAKFEPSIVDAVAKSDVILICVVDYPAMYQAFEPLSSASALAGKIIVNVTNGTPREALEADVFMKARGTAKYFDGAIMVVPQMVGTDHSLLVMSGESEESFDRPWKLLEPLGKTIYVAPDVGAAAAQDIAALASMYGMFAGALIGFALLKRTSSAKNDGPGGAAITPAVQKVIIPLLNAVVPYLHRISDAIDNGTEDDNLGNPLAMQLAGVNNIVNACKQESIDVQSLEVLSGSMAKAVEDGWGDGGVAAVAKYLVD